MIGSITEFLVGLKLKKSRVHEDGFEFRSRKQILKYRRHVMSILKSTHTRRLERSMAKISQGASAAVSRSESRSRREDPSLLTMAGFSRSHLDFDDVSWH